MLIQQQETRHYDLLFFSPHLDDVVLSCAGRLLSELSAGSTALIATLFSRGDQGEWGSRFYEQRRREDTAAVEKVGADCVFLDLPDAPARNSFYRSYRQVYLGEHASDHEFGKEVARTILDFWQSVMPRTTFFPLGVGNHIDHRLVHQSYRSLPPAADVGFYEDRPYSFVKHSVLLRLRQVRARWKASNATPDLKPSPVGVAFWQYLNDMRSIHFYRRYQKDRLFLPLMLKPLLRLPIASPGQSALLHVDPEIIIPPAHKIGKIAAAISSYESQAQALFGNSVKRWFREAEQYTKRIDTNEQYLERYWKLHR